MKTKKISKQRKNARKVKIESELKSEFGDVFSEDFLDEEALILAMADEED